MPRPPSSCQSEYAKGLYQRIMKVVTHPAPVIKTKTYSADRRATIPVLHRAEPGPTPTRGDAATLVGS